MIAKWTNVVETDPRALAIVDGTGEWEDHGPHYSRRTPGAKCFVGPGPSLVLWQHGAVWAVRYSFGLGDMRGHARLRCSIYRNLISGRKSSELIRSAVFETGRIWATKYEFVPKTLFTEVCPKSVASEIPGYCFRRAGWKRVATTKSGLLLFRCPQSQWQAGVRAAESQIMLWQPGPPMGIEEEGHE